ncbi:MAG: ABC transporter substrate-binding protein [Treponema sp.]|jgi:NitT/TauT family transport system substrate-binding protein|nr:ABC transporter substrate-binding protein [Treponema sp.]
MTRTKKIPIAVTLCALLAAFTSCRAKTQTGTARNAQEQTAFQLGLLVGTSHLFGLVGVEEGFFQEEGLNVTPTFFSSSGELVAGLESGKLDAAFIGSVPTITNQAAGHDITIFGGAMTNGHGYVLKSKYIPTGFREGDITVLKGRNIANVRNSMQDYELLVLLRQNGIGIGEGPDKVNIIYFESQKDAFNALAGDQIDGVSVYTPYASIAKNLGHTVVYYCNKVSVFENQPCCRQVALTGALAARTDTYIAFERAIIKAYKFSQENHEKTVEDVAKYTPIDKKDIEYEIYGGHAFSHPDPDKKATATLKKGVVEFGYSNGADYDIEKLYNLDIYRKALTRVLAENPNDSIYKSLETHFNSAN